MHEIVPGRISRMIADERDGGAEGSRKRIGFTAAYDRYSDEIDGNNDVTATGGSRRRLDGATYQAMVNPNDETRDEDQERPGRTSV